jgi:pyruvate formate lyase activating enzyme
VIKEAMFYEKLNNKKVLCNLCMQKCVLKENQQGICGVRQNMDGKLYAFNYGKLIVRHVDPIEKKPLFHFYPGSKVYSIATVGCNFKCQFCQNYDIALMPYRDGKILGVDSSPRETVNQTITAHCKSIAYTYTEPTIFYEYAFDTAKLAHGKGIRNIFVTNGYFSPEALKAIGPYLDAANVDLKSFSNEFYKKICKAKLQPVLDNLKLVKQLNIWIEVTTLIIPTLNDTEDELQSIAEFIADLGKEIPWHVSAFYPAYKLSHLLATPLAILQRAREIGLQAGLRYVYTGNIFNRTGETTYCYNCAKPLIIRDNYRIVEIYIRENRCPYCGVLIDGILN